MTVIISIDLLLKILTYNYYYLYIIINYSLKNCRGLTNYIWNNW